MNYKCPVIGCFQVMQALFHDYIIFSLQHLLYLVVTEYPAVNMLTALRLAPKSTLVVVAQIYA